MQRKFESVQIKIAVGTGCSGCKEGKNIRKYIDKCGWKKNLSSKIKQLKILNFINAWKCIEFINK